METLIGVCAIGFARLCNLWVAKGRAFKPEDFMPKFERQAAKVTQTPAMQQAMFRMALAQTQKAGRG